MNVIETISERHDRAIGAECAKARKLRAGIADIQALLIESAKING